MSQTATQIDAAAELAAWTRQVADMYVKDLNALPEGAFSQPIGGKCRTPQDFTCEVAGFCKMMAARLNGETYESPSPEAIQAYTAMIDTADKAAEEVRSSADALATALTSNPDRLGEPITPPWGGSMSAFQMATIAANHILYHDGQLNLIQSYHGDDQMHWM